MSEWCKRTIERRSKWPSTLRVDFISFLPNVQRLRARDYIVLPSNIKASCIAIGALGIRQRQRSLLSYISSSSRHRAIVAARFSPLVGALLFDLLFFSRISSSPASIISQLNHAANGVKNVLLSDLRSKKILFATCLVRMPNRSMI